MASALNHLNVSSDIWASLVTFPWYHVYRTSLVPGVSDRVTSLLAPVVIYWSVSIFYHMLDVSGWEWLEQYRVQPSSDILKKNLATKRQVIVTVMKIQVCQTALAFVIGSYVFENEDTRARSFLAELRETSELIARWTVKIGGEDKAVKILYKYGSVLTYYAYWWIIPLMQMVFAMFIVDTYQYFVHRALHEITFLYKHVHSVHHRLYVPYAYGSQFNHPVEGIVVDTLSVLLATIMAGLSERQSLFLYSLSAYKAVEDHCGYQFPWHPLRFFTSSNTEFHEIHHQIAGLKSNYSSPLFTFWDRALGTYMTMEQLETKKGSRKTKTY